MKIFERSSTVPSSPERVFAWHARPGAFVRLTPPWDHIRVVNWTGGIQDGARLTMEIGRPPFKLRWTAVHRDYREARSFTDVMERGPFKSWKHVHTFEPDGAGGCVIHDHVEYELPGGPAARIGEAWMERNLDRMFGHRHQRIARDLARLEASAERGPQTVVISGASGLIGSELAAFLDAGGHRVRRLVRRQTVRDGGISWDPAAGRLDPQALEGVDAVVHLSGASVTEGRWNEARRREILDSRVKSTRLLTETLARLERKPRVLLSASAVGIYGDCGDEEVESESHEPGSGFLARVCEEWEEQADAAKPAGPRVVRLRVGVVLTPKGGILHDTLPLFRLGLGGYAGTGRQYVSWISLDDVIGSIHHLIFADRTSGPVNLTAPTPVTARDLARTMGRVLHRPALARIPGSVVRAVLSEQGEAVLLWGVKVRPRALEDSGFTFVHPQLEPALRDALGRWRG